MISNLLEATPGIEPGIAVLQMSVDADQAHSRPPILGGRIAAEMVARFEGHLLLPMVMAGLGGAAMANLRYPVAGR